jgi:hypothetical protein
MSARSYGAATGWTRKRNLTQSPWQGWLSPVFITVAFARETAAISWQGFRQLSRKGYFGSVFRLRVVSPYFAVNELGLLLTAGSISEARQSSIHFQRLEKSRSISRSCKVKNSEIDVEKPGGQLISHLPVLIYAPFLCREGRVRNVGRRGAAETGGVVGLGECQHTPLATTRLHAPGPRISPCVYSVSVRACSAWNAG